MGQSTPSPGDTMRVYLAARWSKRHLLQAYAQELREVNITVTSRWLTEEPPPDREDVAAHGARIGRINADDVKDADAVVIFTERARSHRGHGGRHVELGLSIAWSKMVIIVGPPENAFYCLPTLYEATDWPHALELLVRAQRSADFSGALTRSNGKDVAPVDIVPE